MRNPVIIQGGMGVAVSSWPLAKAVSLAGQLGVVSGTALDVVLVRRLQLGDPGGHLRRAMAEFPFPEMTERILKRYFVSDGKPCDKPFVAHGMPRGEFSQRQLELLVIANFVEVYLAKEGHDGAVGINYLEKIQAPILPSLFGALLARVDYVLMGAGIPRTIPGILDRLCEGQPVELKLDVAGCGPDDRFVLGFDPSYFCDGRIPFLHRPSFLAIVASATLATMLARKANGRIDGFVVEGPTAGGHNAPPRAPCELNSRGEPLYGERDKPDLAVFRGLGLPFWLAGSYGRPGRLSEALEAGAAGVQVGTAFAYCDESGLRADIKQRVLKSSREGSLDVFTDPLASPTGYPFKVLQLSGTLSDNDAYESRKRMCDLGYLRRAYRQADGSLGWRCPAERSDTFLARGGDAAECNGRKCLCNALLANVGLGQMRSNGSPELPLVTSGDDVCQVAEFLPHPDSATYTAQDVIERLLGDRDEPATARLSQARVPMTHEIG
jgi:nitronate monooxygenase